MTHTIPYIELLMDMISIPAISRDESLRADFLEKAISYVHENISEDNLNIEVLSRHMYVSRRHLHRKIKVLTGSSPVDFIKIIRLRKAMELIKDNKLTMAEVAYSVGFSNPSYFANTFKKLYGHPPSFFVK